MNAPTLAETGRTLARLEPGQRAWFWFCTPTRDVHPPLVLTPLGDDPGMTRLTDLVERIPIPPQAVEYMGLVASDERGRLHFGSPDADDQMLPSLAAWCRHALGGEPSLARLVDATCVHYDDDRRISRRWVDASLWQGLRPAEPADPSVDTATLLDALEPGEGTWFWATDRGPEDLPVLALGPVRDDPKGKLFAQRVRRIVLRSPRKPEAMLGLLQILKSGRRVFTGVEHVSRLRALLGALALRPGLDLLEHAIVLRRGAGGFSDGARVEPPDYGDEAELLATLDMGERAYFYLTDANADGLPDLVLDRDKGHASAAAAELASSGRYTKGTVRVHRSGRLIFTTRDAFPHALETLARWARIYHPGWTSLGRLRNARLLERDGAGGITREQRNDRLWDSLSASDA